MSILDGERREATERDCNAPWSGDKRNFRCGFCGYRFKKGDGWRIVYTNDMNKAPGNPLVCDKCYTDKDDTRQRWAEKWAQFREDEWWWFTKWAAGSDDQ